MRGRRWRPLAVFASEELPRPEAMLRADQFLGADRRTAQFLGWHGSGQIEVRGRRPDTRRVGPILSGEYVAVDFVAGELIRGDWSHFAGVEARFAGQPPEAASARRIRLFREMLAAAPEAARLTAPQAVTAILSRRPEAAALFQPAAGIDPESLARSVRREWEHTRGRTKK